MWLAFTTNPHLLDHVAIDGWMTQECWKTFGTIPRVRGGLGQHKPLVGRATGIRQQLPSRLKVPGSGISKLRCTSECNQTLGSAAPGLQSGQVQTLWEEATVRSLLTTG